MRCFSSGEALNLELMADILSLSLPYSSSTSILSLSSEAKSVKIKAQK